YTPATLAAEWGCSPRHVRNLVNSGQLRAFRLGQKLLRIPPDAVEEYEQCQATASAGSMANACSSTTTEPEQGIDTGLGPKTRARLRSLRQRSIRSSGAPKEKRSRSYGRPLPRKRPGAPSSAQ